jgi:hypothetical protein
VREFKLEPIFLPEARQTYEVLPAILQDDVDRRVEYLCQYPGPDDESTFAWPEEGPGVFIYYDAAWVLTYALVDDASVLEVWSLAPLGWLSPPP